MHKTCAVVVTFNRLDLLKKCIDAIQAQSVPCDLLIINNASTDGTKEFLETRDDLISIHLSSNTGGAGGFNTGMKEAVLRGYDFIWIMDDDTFPFADALEELLKADQLLDGNYGWLCSVPLWIDGTECRMNRPKLLKAFYKDIQLLKYAIVRAEQATFVSLFIKSDTIVQHGLPIKEFFIWGDDMEFTRRLSVRKALPCYLIGKSQVTHAMKNNVGSNISQDDFERIDRYNYAFRNDNYLYRQEGLKGFLYYLAKCGLNILRTICTGKDHKILRLWIILKQMFLGLFFNPKIEYVTNNSKTEI